MDSSTPAEPPGSDHDQGYRRIDSEAAYRDGILTVIRHARHELRILDRNLVRMGIDSAAGATALADCLNAHSASRILIAVHDPDWLLSHAPRLASLRSRASHRIELRQVPAHLGHLADSHVLVDGVHGVRRFHHDHARGTVCIGNPAEIAPWWARFEELWGECQAPPAAEFPGL